MKILLVGEGQSELGGALETLVRRLGLENTEIHVDRVSQKSIHAHHGKGQGYFKRAVRWMLEAKKRGFDSLILLIDEDGKRERLREFEQAQQYANVQFARAIGVAIRTFDAWMLADERALSEFCGFTVQRQQDPEGIADPKGICKRLLEESSDTDLPRGETYAAIARAIDLAILEDRCNRGFAPFAQRVRELATLLQ